MSTSGPNPKRGDIWLVNLEPTSGAEIQKTRPAVIISSNSIGKLPLKIIVPITEWKDDFADYQWMVEISPTSTNGLQKKSSIDTLQIRCIDMHSRLVRKLGVVPQAVLDEINASIASVIEYQ